MSRIIAFSNQKGGVGKTTSCVNVGGFLAAAGKRVLLVDLDPQGNLSSGVGIDSKQLRQTTYQVLIEEMPAISCIQSSAYPNLAVLPANIDLSAAEPDLLEAGPGREYRLASALKPIRGNYDFILIDCPPSLGILTINALCAADSVLVVLQSEYYALEGLSQLMAIIHKIQANLNPALQLEGVLLTMYDSKTNLSKQVKDDVVAFFKEKVFSTVVARNVKLSEAPSYGQPIHVYDPKSAGAVAYQEIARELSQRYTL